jgi:N-acetylmuramoyl-L-alanine amidase-like protein
MQIDPTTHRSPNHEPRHEAVSALVLHTGEGTRVSDIATLCLPNGLKSVSAHYYVCRDATVFQLVDDDQIAYHAGRSHYAGRASWNGFSLGIETEHKKGQDWPAVQWDAIRDLCALLIDRYGILRDRRAAHRWIAPTRKTDPSDRDNLFLFDFFSAFGHEDAHLWRAYRVTVDVARVRSEPDTAAPIARKLRRGAVWGGTTVPGAAVGTNKIWIAWRFGGYTHSSLVGLV